MKLLKSKRRMAFFLVVVFCTSCFMSIPVLAVSEYEGATTFTFSDNGIIAAEGIYANYEIKGTDLSIDGPGIYIVSGSCSDGSITVKRNTTDVTLVLDDLTLSSSDTAPITCNKSSHVTIIAAPDTSSTLIDAAYNNDDEYPENSNAENAVLKCKDGSQILLGGSGTLNIVSNGKNGIKSGASTAEDGEAWMEIRELNLNVTATVNDGINAEEALRITSGTIHVTAADDGIHSDRILTIGDVGTSGPDIIVADSYEGLEGADITISSGKIEVHAEDDGINAANSDLPGYPFALTIAGGSVYVDARTGDGLDSNGTLTISGGVLEVYSSASWDNSPLDSDRTFTVSGGTVLAVGNGGMAQTPSTAQGYAAFGSGRMGGWFWGGQSGGRDALSISAGDRLSVKDASGNQMFSGRSVRSANYVFFSSPVLIPGDTYTLAINGQDSMTAVASGVRNTAPPASDSALQPESPRPASEIYDDVAAGSWYEEAVTFVVNEGLFQGAGSRSFAPNGEMSRAMLMVVLARLDGQDTGGGTPWYEKGVIWAMEHEISDGSNSESGVTREQVTTMLYRYAGFPLADTNLSAFSDGDAVSFYARPAVAWAVERGIIAGKTGNILDPHGTATRAEVATILQRYCMAFTIDEVTQARRTE